MSLLQELLDEEIDELLGGQILNAIEMVTLDSTINRRFEFNRFEISLIGDSATVLIEDILEPDGVAVQEITITEFREALRAHCERLE